MKKNTHGIIKLFLVLLILSFSLITTFANEDINVYLDGELLTFDVPPIIRNGRTLVPLRAIFEKLGATVDWDEATQTATATKDFLKVSITIGSSNMACYYTYGDETTIENYTLDVPAMVVNGRTLIPLRAVSEAFWCQVGWDGTDNTISIIDDNYDLTMLYAPGGRSRAFSWNSVCSQLAVGWYEDDTLTNYGNHFDLDSNFICQRCGSFAPPQINMTAEEQLIARNVQYINNREVWHDSTNEQFILTFSFLD
ncbi:MAG: copper amine oxidase N-terminal domain-containing protein, partial [Clostridia bacterium]|nr:copper amine oxidase N-terminal domain-containing protein [Clostridia bacterium]